MRVFLSIFFKRLVRATQLPLFLVILTLGCTHSVDISNSDRLGHTDLLLREKAKKDIQEAYNSYLAKSNIKSIQLLKTKKFKEIIDLNEELQSNFINNINFEKNIDFELSSISNSRENLEPLLNDFINAYPQHYVPYLYRGVYFEGKGWQSRGGKFAKDTKAEQFKWMNHYHSLATSDLNQAISLKDNILHSYIFNIKTSAVNNDSTAFQSNLDSAMKIRPESYGLWITVVGFSAPRWGGSASQMQTVIDYASQYYSKNSLLKNLRLVPIIDQADYADNIGDYKLARELYEKAVDEGFQASPRMRQFNPEIALIDIFFQEEKFNEACALVKNYLENIPVSWEAHTSAVWCKAYNYF